MTCLALTPCRQITNLQNLLLRGPASPQAARPAARRKKQKQRTTWCPSSGTSALSELLQFRSNMDFDDGGVEFGESYGQEGEG